MSKEIKLEHVEEICEGSFALWSSSLFSGISGWNPDLTFEEHKEAFFWLVAKLLDEGKIRFIYPNALCYEGCPLYWDRSGEEFAQFLREYFPKDATHENNRSVNDYFYDVVPPIMWLGEDGKWYGS
jgi:hypothetical protein